MHGACNRGTSCPFSHDLSKPQSMVRPHSHFYDASHFYVCFADCPLLHQQWLAVAPQLPTDGKPSSFPGMSYQLSHMMPFACTPGLQVLARWALQLWGKLPL